MVEFERFLYEQYVSLAGFFKRKTCADQESWNIFELSCCMKLIVEFKAAHARKSIIEKKKAGFTLIDHFKSLRATRSEQGLIGCFLFDGCSEECRYHRIVLDDKDGFDRGIGT